MKKFMKLFSFILAIVFVISIFPVVKIDAAEKKYKLALMGEYDLDDDDKVIYNFSKMMKNIKLEQVEGKNQWNLTMYAGTTVWLPYTSVAATDKVRVTSNSMYVSGNVLYSNNGGIIKVSASESSYKLVKTVTNKVLTCKSYNEASKCLSTLKIVVKILPYNAKLERSKLVTAEELFKLDYHKSNYSEFAWKNVVSKYPEVLLEDYSPLELLANYIEKLDVFEREAPKYLYEKFGGKDAESLANNIYAKDACDVWGYDYELIQCAIDATSEGYQRESVDTLNRLWDILGSLSLGQYDTDWQKVLAVQKWVKANIEYDFTDTASVKKALDTGYAQCSGYVQIMLTMCQLIDIPCYIVSDPHGVYGLGHDWNIVLVDGMWCTMDLTGDVGFGVVDCKNFKGKPNLTAYEELQPVLGGEAHLFGDGLVWDCDEECWEEE